MWRSEVNLRCHFSGAILLCFETKSSHWNLGPSDSATLAAGPTPRIHLSLPAFHPPHTLGSKMHVAIPRFCWFGLVCFFTFVLGFQIQVFRPVRQAQFTR